MPGLPGNQRLAVDFHHGGMIACCNGDDALEVIGIGAVDRGNGVFLQRAKDFADLSLHCGGVLDPLKDDDAAVLEQLVEPGADGGLLEEGTGDAGNPRAEGQVVFQRVDFEVCHVILLMWQLE